MKLFVKLMFVILFLAVMLPFTILKGPDGKTLLSIPDIAIPDWSFDLPELPEVSPGKSTATLQTDDSVVATDDDLSGKDVFYQWYDAEGNVQFTTEPPAGEVPYTVKGYDPNTNVIQAVKINDEVPETSVPDSKSLEKKIKVEKAYQPETIQKLIDDAQNVESMLTQRLQKQDALLNQ